MNYIYIAAFTGKYEFFFNLTLIFVYACYPIKYNNWSFKRIQRARVWKFTKKRNLSKKNQVSFHIFKKMFIYLPKILSAINLYI